MPNLSISFSVYWAKKKGYVKKCACCECEIIGDIYYPVLQIKDAKQTTHTPSNIEICKECYFEVKKKS